jgi:hypothetical protein
MGVDMSNRDWVKGGFPSPETGWLGHSGRSSNMSLGDVWKMGWGAATPVLNVMNQADYGKRWDEWQQGEEQREGEMIDRFNRYSDQYSTNLQNVVGGLERRSANYFDPNEVRSRWQRAASPYGSEAGAAAGTLQTQGRLQREQLARAKAHSGGVGTGIGEGYDARTALAATQGRGITGGYEDRYRRGMGYLEGQGEQQRRDLNTAYDASGAAQQAELASRGLGGTTIRSGLSQANTRERSAAICLGRA